jgi:hypothetical protein
LCLTFLGTTACTNPPVSEPSSEQRTEPSPERQSDASAPDAQPDDRTVTPPPKTEIKSPDKIEPLKLDISKFELPKALVGDTRLIIEGSKSTGVLVGGKAGLYQVGTQNKLELVDAGPVVGIVQYKPSERTTALLLVARSKQIQLWEGALRTSGIHQNFDGDEITAMIARTEKEIWIGTRTKLWRLKDQELGVVDGIKGVKWLATSKDSNVLMVQDQLGSFFALKTDDKGGSWSVQNLSDEGKPFDKVLSIQDGRFWGLAQGSLYQRIVQKDKAGWWPYRIQPDKKNNNVELHKIQSLQLDPTTGLTWALTEGDLFRLQGTIAMKLKRPDELKAVTSAWISQDGLLWLANGTTLLRLGNKEAALSYGKDIKTFLAKNCDRCHAGENKTARAIENFSQTVKELSAIITSVENGNMPLDKKPLLGGDKGIFRRWRDQGMKK